MTKKKRVYLIAADQFACGKERITKPYSKLTKQSTDIEFFIHPQDRPEVKFNELLLFDAIVFQRPTHKAIPNVIKELQKLGKKVVIEIDDRLDFVHRQNIASRVFHNGSEANQVFFECLQLADAVHVSTPELEEAYKLKNKNRNIKTFFNAIDLTDPIYNMPKLRDVKEYPKDQINVMWAGSTSHWDSVNLIKGVIEHAILQNDKAHLIICGNKEFFDIFDLPEDRKTYIEGVMDVNIYPVIPSHADIFLQPLLETPFNHGKSELKILEAAIWKIPSISTPVRPYERFNQLSNGGNILVKKNKPKEWIKETVNLINNPELRKEMGEKSYKAIVEHYDLEKINAQRLEWWRDFLK